jgi:hypothetical protein
MVPLVFLVGHLFTTKDQADIDLVSYIIGALTNYGLYAYILAFVVGVPALFAMISLKRTRCVDYMLAGFLISLLPCVIIYSVFGVEIPAIYAQCALAGALSGLVFWLVAYWNLSSES